VCFESRYERYRPERHDKWHETLAVEEGGGLLNDLGTHVIDQALSLFGDPTSVYAEIAQRRRGVTVDDDVFLALRFSGGQVAHLWVSNIPRLLGPRFRVVGMHGVYEKHGIDPQEAQLRDGQRPGSPEWATEGPEHWGHLVGEQAGSAIDRRYPTVPGRYQDFYASFRDALAGSAGVPVKPEDAVRVLEIVEEARRTGSTR
jgi:predicted dehydrogenase